MQIYLDARDLISLGETKCAEAAGKFGETLRRGGSKLIYSMHNVLECCAPLVRAGAGSSVMRTLSRLERVPHVYVAEARIEALELEEARSAFLEQREYTAMPLPIAPRFDHVIAAFEKRPATSAYLGYGLAQIVFELWSLDRRIFTGYPLHAERLRTVLEADRKRDDYRRQDLNFKNKVGRDLDLYGIRLPGRKVVELAEWIYHDPTRCPAFRLGYEVYHKVLRNLKDVAKDSDIADFAHISCVPYVDAITLDNRMRGYVAQVDQSIGTNYSQHIYRNIDEIEGLLVQRR